MTTPDYFVDFPGLGIKDIPISREAFNLFGISIYWYGLLIAGAIILCMILAIRQAKRYDLTSDNIMDTFIAIIPLMLIFARLYYVVFEWKNYSGNLWLIFDTRQGGLGFYGGVIGGVLAVILVCRIKKIPLSRMMDFLVVYVPLGQAIGRLGNFFNQEAFGNNTTLPWGMFSNQTQAYLTSIGGTVGGTLDPSLPVHPTFLYEFIANMLIFVVLIQMRKSSKTPMKTTLWYLLLYGLVRFFVEGIRTDPLVIGDTGIRISELISALMVVGSIIGLIVARQVRIKREQAAALAKELAIDSPDSENPEDKVFIEIKEEPADKEKKD